MRCVLYLNTTNLTMEVASLQEDLVDFFRRYGNSINLPETDFGTYNGAKTLRFQLKQYVMKRYTHIKNTKKNRRKIMKTRHRGTWKFRTVK